MDNYGIGFADDLNRRLRRHQNCQLSIINCPFLLKEGQYEA